MTTDTDRRIQILQFVAERQRVNKKTTKADVIRHLKENKLASRQTAHDLINQLIEEEKKLNKEEINSQVHFLTINDENKFIQIYLQLVGLANQIERLQLPKHHPTKEEWAVLDIFSAIKDMQKLKLPSEEDSQVLNSKLIKLFSELAVKILNAWGEADKEYKDELRKSKTRRPLQKVAPKRRKIGQ